jgi:uncharacterized OB-fold protein
MSAALPRPAPNADSLAYWTGARDHRLLIRSCNNCGTKHFMPRHFCPKCWSDDLKWIEASGHGSVHSFSVVHRAPTKAFAENAPYVVALIDLDEGPRMFANVVGDGALEVSIGERVSVFYEDRGEGAMLPQFARAAQ